MGLQNQIASRRDDVRPMQTSNKYKKGFPFEICYPDVWDVKMFCSDHSRDINVM